MELIITAVKVVLIPVIALTLVPVLIWMERKGAAYFQDRRGPNRAQIFGVRLGGMIHNIADVIKLLTKEEFFPTGANRFYFVLAPMLTMFIYFVATAVIPLGDDLVIGGMTIPLRVANLNVGLLYIFAMSSLAVYGVMLAGWASNNKYSFLGALRSSSQMISYEIALGLSVVALFMLAESADLHQIVLSQTASIFSWNVFHQPLAFFIFLVAIFAETQRTPFDLPEGESELVAGYHVEYSSMKFALFFMGEYVAMVVASAMIAGLFFGGWQVPFLGTQDLIEGVSFYLPIFGIGASAALILIGLLLLSKYKKGKWGDLRDYESLILGIPMILIGAGLSYFLVAKGLPTLPSWAGPVFAAAVQFVTFLAKTLFFCFFFIWVRWTLPRFRYDQLMSFGWKGLIPLALANILITGIVILI